MKLTKEDIANDPDIQEKLELYDPCKKIEPTTHSRLSPSAAKRWMTCPGSVKLIESLNLPRTSNKYAAEGTVAHEVGEMCLTTGNKPEHYLGNKMEADGFKFKVTDNMVEAVEEYVTYIDDQILMAEEGADLHVELQVEVKCSLTSLGVKGMDGGTSDTILICKEEMFLEAIDYKHGQGVAVEVHDDGKINPQLGSYGAGALIKICEETKTKPEDWKIGLTIVQPRAHHPEGGIRSFAMTGEELMTWVNEELIPAGKLTHGDNAPFKPSDDGCRFCEAAGQCPALFEKTQEIAMLDFKDDAFPKPETMSAKDKKTVMDHAVMLRAFITAVENQVKLEVDSGSREYEDRYKLVRKKTNRKFIDDALDPDFGILLDHLEEGDLFIQKPCTMTDIEKKLKKEHGAKEAKRIMDECTIKPDGDLVIAPLSDKRRAAQPSIVSDFDDLD